MLGPYTIEEFEEKSNDALAEMKCVFVVSTQTIKEEDGLWVIVTYKESF